MILLLYYPVLPPESEPKTWYSISPDDGKRFETFAASLFAEQSRRCSAWLRHKTSLINPSLIRQNGIKVVFMMAIN